MIRNRFDELQKYLKARLPQLGILPEQFDTVVDKLTLGEGGHHETAEGYHFCNLRYTGLIYLERLPAAQLPLLALLVRSWIDEHDDTRSRARLPDPELDVAPLDGDSLVDVVVTLEFVDPVFLAPAADDAVDAVDWNGKRYSVAEYTVAVAERGTVNNAPAAPEAGA